MVGSFSALSYFPYTYTVVVRRQNVTAFLKIFRKKIFSFIYAVKKHSAIAKCFYSIESRSVDILFSNRFIMPLFYDFLQHLEKRILCLEKQFGISGDVNKLFALLDFRFG